MNISSAIIPRIPLDGAGTGGGAGVESSSYQQPMNSSLLSLIPTAYILLLGYQPLV